MLFLKKFIFIAVILTIIFGFAFTLSQQVLRQSANDPQIQIAEDSAVTLARGEGPDFYRSNVYGSVEVTKSLAPFLMTFDGNGKMLASNVTINGKTPQPPAGVFTYAKKHGIDKITWQPAKGVRIAAAVAYYGGQREGFALAGRSLTEVENRIGALQTMSFWAWLISIIISAIFVLFSVKAAPARRFNKGIN
jgi:hypothetical protein